MKYIFIDSNQYRHIFSPEEGFSDQIHDLLIKLVDKNKITLLLPQQTKEEVERNRCRDWAESALKKNKNIEKLSKLLAKVKDGFDGFNATQSLKQEIDDQIEEERHSVKDERKKTYNFFTDKNNKPNKKLSGLFQKAQLIAEDQNIIRRAELRYKKGNPPYDEESMGDALIWESLLQYLSAQNDSDPILIFVANDKRAWGDDFFDQWLEDEFRSKVGGSIEYSHKLADIEELTEQEQGAIRKAEQLNLKRNAISDFVSSPNWVSAGENARALAAIKKTLTSEDYQQIIEASVNNNQIYGSFFTSTPLFLMVSGENGYVVRQVEEIDEKLWKEFKKIFNIDLKRQSDEKVSSRGEIRIEDIPF